MPFLSAMDTLYDRIINVGESGLGPKMMRLKYVLVLPNQTLFERRQCRIRSNERRKEHVVLKGGVNKVSSTFHKELGNPTSGLLTLCR